MFRAILFTQWRWSRLIVVFGSLAAFTIPVLSVQTAGLPNPSQGRVFELLNTMGAWGIAYPILAAGMALTIAIAAWAADHRGKHVYALSLPIHRWQYALYRFSAGLILLAGPVLCVWLGAGIAVKMAVVPPGLATYATSLTLRFALAALIANSLFFAISAGTNRTAGYFLGIIGTLLIIQLVLGATSDVNVLEPLVDRIFAWPGPLEIFTGRWMLIDV